MSPSEMWLMGKKEKKMVIIIKKLKINYNSSLPGS